MDCVIFTDLDGTLLDASTYSYEAADRALTRIAESRIPLVLVSSKTRAEMEPLRSRLALRDPFVVENGGAVFIPMAYFPFSVGEADIRSGYSVIEIGTPYADLRAALGEMKRRFAGRLRGFGDMTVEEVVTHTGLSQADARLAKQREFDEPFLSTIDNVPLHQLNSMAEEHGLRCTKGGRFYHLMGRNDKGTASLRLIEAYRRFAKEQGRSLMTIGIGDSLNDLPMLQVVDCPVLVQKPDGSYDSAIALSDLMRAPGIGPVGWNQAVLHLIGSN
jgi:mannosyl-3-phosphoglycerate phosphatase